MEHYGSGLVKVDFEEEDKTEIVNITSLRCHPIGWSMENRDQNFVVKSSKTGPDYMNLPKWLFNCFVLKKHKFEVF